MIIGPEISILLLPSFGVLLGLIIGSFLANLVVRWPQGRSVMKGRSVCDNCGRELKVLELVPVISFFIQKGQCRTCEAPISKQHLAIELSAALIGGLALIVAPNVTGIFGAIFGWLLMTLAALDAEHHWLPDQLTAMLAATGLLSVVVVTEPTVSDRLVGGATGFLVLILINIAYKLFRGRDGLGGGDPKMLGGIGLWMGWQYLSIVLLGASVIGLMFALLVKIQNRPIGMESEVPLGSLMAIAAFPIWLFINGSGNVLG